jgi:hypothetical protein
MSSNFKIYDTIPCNENICETINEPEYIPMSVYEQMTDFELQPRINACMNILVNAAARKYNGQNEPQQNINNDHLDPKKVGIYSKGLPHNSIGEVDLEAYESLENAVKNGAGNPDLFDKVIMGGKGSQYRKLVNPQSGLAFDLEGYDSHFITVPASPSVYSQEAMDELLENYWMSITRDVNFSDYDTNPITIDAANDLSSKQQFYAPRINNQVTPQTLFRGYFTGDLIGPYISQFLYLNCPYGASTINQKIKTFIPEKNFVKDYNTFLDIQNGKVPSETQLYDSELRYIRNGRDLAAWVKMDVLYGAYLNALNILMNKPSAATQNCGINCPVSITNPYKSPNPSSINQVGFATFGEAHITALLAEVSQRALKAAWAQKWFFQKRLRPEEMAGLVYNEINKIADYGLNKDYLNSSYFTNTINNGNPLLESAYNEGSPLHPSYLAGHSSVAGCCVTILKAWFDNDYIIPNPVKPSADGLSLEPYIVGVDGPALTVGNELNKLCSNIGLGRNIASVHYRSDMLESSLMGEEQAVQILRDQSMLYNEKFEGFRLTKFDGTKILINKDITIL